MSDGESDELTLEAYKALFQLARDAVLIQKADLSIMNANPSAETLFGYSLSELIDMKCEDLLGIEFHDNVSCDVSANASLSEHTIIHTEAVSKEGSKFAVEVFVAPFRHRNSGFLLSVIRRLSQLNPPNDTSEMGQLTTEQQVAEHIRQLVQTNEELLLQEQRYNNLLESSPQGIVILEGPPYAVSFCNSAASSMLGYSSEELEQLAPDGLPSLVNWADRNRVLKAFGDVSSGKVKASQIETRFNTKSNDVIWIDLSVVSLDTSKATSLLITMIDNTKKHQAIVDLSDSARDLELYASILRHDLKNDLQVIIGNADVIRLSAPENETIQQFAEASIAGAERMFGMLKIFGKPDSGKSRNIAPILEEASVEAAQLYVGMKCRLHIDPSVLMVRVRSGRMLSLVFRNLISNSAKHAGKNARVSITAERREGFIEIRVSDNGPGVAEEIKPRLFSKGVSTTGGGLGLYLSKRIVEAYGGTLDLLDTSPDQSGATFLVRLAIDSG